MFLKIGVPKDFANFTGKHLGWSLFLLKREVFSSEIYNTFFTEHLRWLLRIFLCFWKIS